MTDFKTIVVATLTATTASAVTLTVNDLRAARVQAMEVEVRSSEEGNTVRIADGTIEIVAIDGTVVWAPYLPQTPPPAQSPPPTGLTDAEREAMLGRASQLEDRANALELDMNRVHRKRCYCSIRCDHPKPGSPVHSHSTRSTMAKQIGNLRREAKRLRRGAAE